MRVESGDQDGQANRPSSGVIVTSLRPPGSIVLIWPWLST